MSLALALTAAPKFVSEAGAASEVITPAPTCPTKADAAREKVPQAGRIAVELFVTIPSERLRFRHELDLDPGTTAAGAAKAAYKIEQGLVCCDARDVKSINGLAMDPYKEKWWVVLINGNMQNSSPRTVLKNGDVVEWRYEEKAMYEAAHVRLEDWVEKQQEIK